MYIYIYIYVYIYIYIYMSYVIFKEGAMNVLFVWRNEMSSAVTSLYRHATAESVLILMAIASHVLISYSVTDARMITKHPPYP